MKTGKNNIPRIADHLVQGKVDPTGLSKSEKNIVIEYLRYESCLTLVKIASIMKMHKDTVRSRLMKIDEAFKTRLMARGFDPWRVISELERTKEIVQTKAGQKGNWGLVWKVEREAIEKYIQLGFIKQNDMDMDFIDITPEDKELKELDPKEIYKKMQEIREQVKQETDGKKSLKP